MLHKCYLNSRYGWISIAITTIILELVALYFQYVMLIQPCVICIYERCTLFGILGAALIGACAPKSLLLSYAATMLWIYSAWQGVRLSWMHTMIQLNPSPFSTCDLFVIFPSWMPLDKWIPTVFLASNDCNIEKWSFLTLTMPQWMVFIFTIYLFAAFIVLVIQLIQARHFCLFVR